MENQNTYSLESFKERCELIKERILEKVTAELESNDFEHQMSVAVNGLNEFNDYLQTAISQMQKPVEQKRRKPICVRSLTLAYKIINEGYLYLLFSVKPDMKNPKRKVFFFAPEECIQRIVDEYREISRKYNQVHNPKEE